MTNSVIGQRQAIVEIGARNRVLGSESKAGHALRFQNLIDEIVPKMNALVEKLTYIDQTRTEAARFIDYHKASKITADAAFKAVQSGQRITTELEAEIAQKEDARLGFKRGNQDRTAIIAKFSALSPADQQKQIGIWMKDAQRGGAMLGIVSEADPFLTGLTSEQAARLRTDFVKSHAPDLADERDEVTQGLQNVIAMNYAVKLATDDIQDERRYAAIINQKAKADATNAAFAPSGAVT